LQKKRQNSDKIATKSDKKRQNANKKIGSSKEATKSWCSFWSVAAHPRPKMLPKPSEADANHMKLLYKKLAVI
jgi:hypothetical protein